jgi:hypothetical protein
MISRTVTTVLDAPSERVFEFLADVANLPAWATEFARTLRLEDGRVWVTNGLGEFLVRYDADPASGVIDIYAGPSEDALALFPTRVVGLSSSCCAFSFTMFQEPGMSDELFAAQHASLEREFANIDARFAGRTMPSA